MPWRPSSGQTPSHTQVNGYTGVHTGAKRHMRGNETPPQPHEPGTNQLTSVQTLCSVPHGRGNACSAGVEVIFQMTRPHGRTPTHGRSRQTISQRACTDTVTPTPARHANGHRGSKGCLMVQMNTPGTRPKPNMDSPQTTSLNTSIPVRKQHTQPTPDVVHQT